MKFDFHFPGLWKPRHNSTSYKCGKVMKLKHWMLTFCKLKKLSLYHGPCIIDQILKQYSLKMVMYRSWSSHGNIMCYFIFCILPRFAFACVVKFNSNQFAFRTVLWKLITAKFLWLPLSAGLYTVERHWFTTGLSGYGVFKFALKRCPGQAPLHGVIQGKRQIPQRRNRTKRTHHLIAASRRRVIQRIEK